MSNAVSNSEFSKHIRQIKSDIVTHNDHRKYDVEIRELLRHSANRKLRNAQIRSEYHDLVAMVIKNYDVLDHKFKKNVNLIKVNYTNDNVSDEAWADFKRMVDMCVVHGRFRDIRVLCELVKAFGLETSLTKNNYSGFLYGRQVFQGLYRSFGMVRVRISH